ncbi:MAG TPA: tetratricopeptide repeat protein [Gemmataceae bacterium]|nr:tetratricopeptide repeat protein [Gemmataceae bacterium]
MNTHRLLFASLVLVLLAESIQARYRRPDLEMIPVARLVENLEKIAAKKPKDAQVRFNLARAHAMAYALKTDTAQVFKGKEMDGAWFGYEPNHVPFAAKASDDAAKVKTAQEHLAKAIDIYKEAIKLAPTNLTARLGLAWCIDQSKNKKEAIKEYQTVIEDAWKKEKDLEKAPLGWHSVTAEAAGYLIPLLDPGKDNAEIRILEDRIKKMRMVPRPVTPIVIPLRDGLSAGDLVDPSATVAFDADGSGLKRKWTWITKDAGWLVIDPRGTKKITSGLQLFGNVTFWMFWDNGYQALSALDANGDGWLTGKELDGLAIWHDKNGDGICDPGEVKSLAEWGIVALSCRCQIDSTHPDRIPFSPLGVRFRDGVTRSSYDVVLRRQTQGRE